MNERKQAIFRELMQVRALRTALRRFVNREHFGEPTPTDLAESAVHEIVDKASCNLRSVYDVLHSLAAVEGALKSELKEMDVSQRLDVLRQRLALLLKGTKFEVLETPDGQLELVESIFSTETSVLTTICNESGFRLIEGYLRGHGVDGFADRILGSLPMAKWSNPMPLSELAKKLDVECGTLEEKLIELEMNGSCQQVTGGWMLPGESE